MGRTLRIVLMTTGLNAIARALPTLPGECVGIIEVLSGEPERRWRTLTRRALRKLQGRHHADLAQFCAHHKLSHARLHKSDSTSIHAILKQLNTDLVLTCSCPLLSMDCFTGLTIGAINLHDALLPAYRGGNPLFWQVLDQVDRVGVSIHFLDAGVDTGKLLGQRSAVRPTAVSRSRLQALVENELGVALLHEVISSLASGTASPKPQPKQSPTRAARHQSMVQVAELLDQEKPALQVLWDLAHYWGHWPSELGRYRGWRSRCYWVPIAINHDSTTAVATDDAPDYSAHAAQTSVYMELRHRQGTLTLAPALRPRG